MKPDDIKKAYATSRIQHERIVLTPFTEDRISDAYLGWLNDPEVVRYSRQRLMRHTAETAREYWRLMQGSNYLYWAILESKTGRHIGNITITLDFNNSIAEIAILIGDRTIWGQGYGGDAWMGAMKFLLETVGVRMITSGCMATNKGMMRVMEKAGMQPYYRQEGFFLVDGEAVDSVNYVQWNRA